MSKIVVLNFESGNWKDGFSVTLQIGQEGSIPSTQKRGRLPAAPELETYYYQWQAAYLRLPIIRRLEAPDSQVVNVSNTEECQDAAIALASRLNSWLNSEAFVPLSSLLYTKLQQSESIRFILQTEDASLRQLPWHLWNFFNQYRKAELTISSPCYDNKTVTQIGLAKEKLRILAILGNSEGINIDLDRQELESLPEAETVFLVEPSREEISHQLWEQSWDILFFAGHSGAGKIAINPQESINLEQLKAGLQNARSHGLHLVILNSCDGLDLAQQLEELQIPQIIVMREPVPDRVAQCFLMYFLKALSKQDSIYLAMRNARERLSEANLESDIPGASWLPVLLQNVGAAPLVWQKPKLPKLKKAFPFKKMVISVSILAISLGILRLFFPSDPVTLKLYQDSQHGFKIKYPEKWETNTDSITKEIQFVSPLENSKDQFQEVFIVNKEFLPSSDLEQVSQLMLKRITTEFTTMLVAPSPIQVNDFEARQAIYFTRQDDLELQVRQIWLISDRQAYIFIYKAEKEKYEQYEPIFQQVVNSFEKNE